MYPDDGCYDRGSKTNPHGPYGVGYRRATRVINKVMQDRKKELNIKNY